ncbi:MAG: energy transducer TonB [Bacteroidales bacterium]|nr:energy transducer TonB [Bacteroidales bacterium]
MKTKKSKNKDLENKRILFLEIGFIVALGFVLMAFEYKSYEKIEYTKWESFAQELPDEIVPIIQQKVKPPALPPQQVTVIHLVDNHVDVIDVIEIDVLIDEGYGMDDYFPIDEPTEIPEEKIFKVVEEMPEFNGGMASMYRFIGRNIEYPRQAKEMGISGKVFITFVVEKDGSITDVKVIRGIGGGCDEEALRVIQLMPKWNPGKQRGKPVRVQFQMPIKFTLQ